MGPENLSPIVAALLYERSNEPSGGCECRGQCGGRHFANSGGVCGRDLCPLRLAPRDAGLSMTRAATLPADELMLWCHDCRDGAEAAARRERRKRLAAELDAAQGVLDLLPVDVPYVDGAA